MYKNSSKSVFVNSSEFLKILNGNINGRKLPKVFERFAKPAITTIMPYKAKSTDGTIMTCEQKNESMEVAFKPSCNTNLQDFEVCLVLLLLIFLCRSNGKIIYFLFLVEVYIYHIMCLHYKHRFVNFSLKNRVCIKTSKKFSLPVAYANKKLSSEPISNNKKCSRKKTKKYIKYEISIYEQKTEDNENVRFSCFDYLNYLIDRLWNML
ncbi:hypothetical protein BDAP_001819 [Binucleata daphniae]